MLGGYYLGQAYLGISGCRLCDTSILVVHNSVISHTVDNISIVQYLDLLVDNAIIGLSSDNIDLVSGTLLLIDDCLHQLSSDNILLHQSHSLLVDDSAIDLTSDNILKITNWTELNKDFGVYVRDFVNTGELQNINAPETSIYIVKNDNSGKGIL